MSETESPKPNDHGDLVLFARALNQKGIIASPTLLSYKDDIKYLFPNFPVEEGRTVAEYLSNKDISLFIKRSGRFPSMNDMGERYRRNKIRSVASGLFTAGSFLGLHFSAKELMEAAFPNNWETRHNDAVVECEKSVHDKFDKDVQKQSAANQDVTHKGYSVHAEFSAATATQAVQECVPLCVEGQQIKDIMVGTLWVALFVGLSSYFARSAAGHIGDFLESRNELKTFEKDCEIVKGDRNLLKQIRRERKTSGHSHEVA